MLASAQLLDDEVEQRLPRGEHRTRQRQNVMTEPLGERAQVARQLMRTGFHLTRQLQRGGEIAGRPTRAGPFDLDFELLGSRTRSPSEIAQRVGEPFALVLDMKHIAMARRVAPGGPLPGAQALSRI